MVDHAIGTGRSAPKLARVQALGLRDTVLVKGSRFMRMERVVRHCTQGKNACCSH